MPGMTGSMPGNGVVMDIRPIRSRTDYDWALAEIPYFDDVLNLERRTDSISERPDRCL